MERLNVLVNDAAHAQRFLQPLLSANPGQACTVVLCPPRLTHRIGKWLSNRQRLQWQARWAQDLQSSLQPTLPSGAEPTWLVANGNPAEMVARLRRQQGPAAKLLDLRRPQLGHELPSAEPDTAAQADDRWKAPLAISSSLSVVLALVD